MSDRSYTVSSAYFCVDAVRASMVEESTPPKLSVLANFCAESEASAISPEREEMAATTFWAAADAIPPATPAIAAPFALRAEPIDAPICEPAEVPALLNLDTIPPVAPPALLPNDLEKAAAPDVPALPSALSIFAANPLMVGMMVTDAVPTFTDAIYAPPSCIPSILSMPSRACSALSRRRSASARSAGVRSGFGLLRLCWPSLVLCHAMTSSACTAIASMYSQSPHRSSGDCLRAVRDSRGSAYQSSDQRVQSSPVGSMGRSIP